MTTINNISEFKQLISNIYIYSIHYFNTSIHISQYIYSLYRFKFLCLPNPFFIDFITHIQIYNKDYLLNL